MTSSSPAAVVGSFNYLVDTVDHSLHRNGKVLTRRDHDGSDAKRHGVDLVLHNVDVHNARLMNEAVRPTLATNGFEMQPSTMHSTDIDFLDHESVVADYYSHCADLVQQATGARFVAAFDHNVRSAVGKKSAKRIQGGQQVQGPAHIVHGDYTLTSAPQRMRDLTKPPGPNDTIGTLLQDGDSLLDEEDVKHALAAGRFAIINVWRNISDEPVATHPLALCDALTVKTQDLVVFEIHYSDRVGENYLRSSMTSIAGTTIQNSHVTRHC